MLREVKLKETCRDNEIICVYKIKTPDGDVSGYYNTNSEWFYSMLDGSDYMDLCTTKSRTLSFGCTLPWSVMSPTFSRRTIPSGAPLSPAKAFLPT